MKKWYGKPKGKEEIYGQQDSEQEQHCFTGLEQSGSRKKNGKRKLLLWKRNTPPLSINSPSIWERV